MINQNHLRCAAAGTGKTAIMRNKLAALNSDATATASISMNSLSDAPSLQLILDQYLEKKSGEPMHLWTDRAR